VFEMKRDGMLRVGKTAQRELQLVFSLNIIATIKSKRMRWARHVARMGMKENVYTILVGKLEEKRPVGRYRRKWKNNIK
jgi:hypothetical protein